MTTEDARPSLRRRLSPALLAVLLAGGCATLGGDPGQPLVPTRCETRIGPFAVFSNVPIAADAPAVVGLRALERDLANDLGLRAANDGPPVEIYILRDREAFGHFLTFYYPELPPRRAFFLAQGPRRVIYTFHNDRLDEDLRHEGTHALLHASVGDLPLWLDEGLAEYYEGPDGRRGLNPEHLARLPDDLETGWRPDLARLETLKSVRDMSPRDYRESWAWVHYLLDGSPPGKAALLAHLSDLSTRPDSAAPLSQRLALLDPNDPAAVQCLLTHLDHTRSAPVAATVAPAPDPTILLQNSPASPPRRSFFGRFLSMIGLSGKKDDGR